jgi:hypothetical protein
MLSRIFSRSAGSVALAFLFNISIATGQSLPVQPCDWPIMSTVTGNGQSAAPGKPLPEPVVVRITCKNGANLATPITFSATNGFTFIPAAEGIPKPAPKPTLQVKTDAQGYAAAVVIASGTPDVTSTITASALDERDIPSARFVATTTTAANGPLKKLAGDEQDVGVNGTSPRAFELLVSGPDGKPLADVPVTFSVISGNGSLTGDPRPNSPTSPTMTVRSDFSGRVRPGLGMVFFRAGPTKGRAVVQASAAGATVQFTINIAGRGPLAAPTFFRMKRNADGSTLFEWDQPVQGIPADAKIVVLGRGRAGEWETITVLPPSATSYLASAAETAPFNEFAARTQAKAQ